MSDDQHRGPSLRITGLGNVALEYLANPPTSANSESQYQTVADHTWRGRKQAQTILKVLLCRPHRKASREALQEALWPQGKGEAAEGAFNALMSVLRHILSLPITPYPLLTVTRIDDQTMYQLAPQAFIWFDADEAESLLTQAEQARRDHGDPVPFLEQAYAFFKQGPLFAEDDGEWLQQRKWHIDEAAHRCTSWLLDLYEERGLPRQATTVLSELFASDPTDEDILARLMTLLAQQGRRHEALRCYQRAERALQAEEMEMTPAIRKLAERIRNEAIEGKSQERFGENHHIPLQTFPLPIAQGIIGTVQESESLDMDKLRRRILQQTPAIVGTTLLTPDALLNQEVLERLLQVFKKPSSLDRTSFLNLEAITRRKRQKFATSNVSAWENLFEEVSGHLKMITSLLDHSHPESTHFALCSLASETTLLLGDILFNAGYNNAAERHYNAAFLVAKEIHNDTLQAVILGRKSFIPLYGNDPQEALLLLEHAQSLVNHDMADIILSWLYAITGETFAYLQNTNACLKALDKAEFMLEQGHSGKITYSFAPETAFAVFSISKLLGYKGASLIRLKQPLEAQQVLRKTLASADSADIHLRSITIVDLGITFVQQVEIKEACECASQALSLTEKTKSARVYQRILNLRHALEPWNHMRQIQAFDEQLIAVRSSIASGEAL